jgi:hypothetical protein
MEDIDRYSLLSAETQKTVDDYLMKCLICHNVKEEAVILHPCNHSYCRNCIKKWFDQNKNICPYCRTVVSHYKSDNTLRTQINSLPCVCPFKCPWKSTLLYLPDHVKTCPKSIVFCCGKKIERDLFMEHYKKHLNSVSEKIEYNEANYAWDIKIARSYLYPPSNLTIKIVVRLEKYAHQMRPEAMHLLGMCYTDGLGVPKNIQIAKELFTSCVKKKFFPSFWKLCCCLVNIDKNVLHTSTIFDLLYEGSELGSMDCVYGLGALYLEGKYLPKNIDKAINILEAVAYKGHMKSIKLLDSCYAQINQNSEKYKRGMATLNKYKKILSIREGFEKFYSIVNSSYQLANSSVVSAQQQNRPIANPQLPRQNVQIQAAQSSPNNRVSQTASSSSSSSIREDVVLSIIEEVRRRQRERRRTTQLDEDKSQNTDRRRKKK